jgi:uncharacterized protein YoxC
MLQLLELKKKLIQDINESQLPIDAVYYVMKDLETEINSLFEQTVQQEENQKQEEPEQNPEPLEEDK